MPISTQFIDERRIRSAMNVGPMDGEEEQLYALDVLSRGNANALLGDKNDPRELQQLLADFQNAARTQDPSSIWTQEKREWLAHEGDDAWRLARAKERLHSESIGRKFARAFNEWEVDDEQWKLASERDRIDYNIYTANISRWEREATSLFAGDDRKEFAKAKAQEARTWLEQFTGRLRDQATIAQYEREMDGRNIVFALPALKEGLSETGKSIVDSAVANGMKWDDSRWGDFRDLPQEEQTQIASVILALTQERDIGAWGQFWRRAAHMAKEVWWDSPADTAAAATQAWFTDRNYQDEVASRARRRQLLQDKFKDLGTWGNAFAEAGGILGYGSAFLPSGLAGRASNVAARMSASAGGAARAAQLAGKTAEAAELLAKGQKLANVSRGLYVGSAALAKMGTALYAIDNQSQYLQRIALDGGDVSDAATQIAAWSFGVASAMVENIQWERFGGVRGLDDAQINAYSKIAHSLFGGTLERYGIRDVAGLSLGKALGTVLLERISATGFEAFEEAIQQTMEETVVSFGVNGEVRLADAIGQGIDAFTQSLAPMALTMLAGTLNRGSAAALSPSFDLNQQEKIYTAAEQVVRWMKNGSWNTDWADDKEKKTAIADLSVMFGRWGTAESDEDALHVLQRMGMGKADAQRFDAIFRSIRGGAFDLSRETGARQDELLPGGMLGESASAVLAMTSENMKGGKAEVTPGEDGSETIESTVTIGGRTVRLVEDVRRETGKIGINDDLTQIDESAARSFVASMLQTSSATIRAAMDAFGLGKHTAEEIVADKDLLGKAQAVKEAFDLRESGSTKTTSVETDAAGNVTAVHVGVALDPSATRATIRHEHTHAIEEVLKAVGLSEENARKLATSAVRSAFVSDAQNREQAKKGATMSPQIEGERFNEEMAPVVAEMLRTESGGPVADAAKWAWNAAKGLLGLQKKRQASRTAVDFLLHAMTTGNFENLDELTFETSASDEILREIEEGTGNGEDAGTAAETAAEVATPGENAPEAGEPSGDQAPAEGDQVPPAEGDQAPAEEAAPEEPGQPDVRDVARKIRMREPVTFDEMAAIRKANRAITTGVMMERGYRRDQRLGVWKYCKDLDKPLDERDKPQKPYVGTDGETHDPAAEAAKGAESDLAGHETIEAEQDAEAGTQRHLMVASAKRHSLAALEDIASGKEYGTLHNSVYGEIRYPLGRMGKNGMGFLHIVEQRMRKDGATLEEAIETAQRVGIAAEIGVETASRKNTRWLDHEGTRAIIALTDNGNPIITGYEISADETPAAYPSTDALLPTPLDGKESIVAALKERLALERQKVNSENPGRQMVGGRLPSPEFAMDGTIADALPAHLREDARAIIAEKANTPAWMVEPDGTPTDLNERDWLRREAEARHAAGRRLMISGLYTGSAADYAQRDENGNIVNGPSLHYVGRGTGSSYYGWGLYATSDKNGANTYANKVSGQTEEGRPYRFRNKKNGWTSTLARMQQLGLADSDGSLTKKAIREGWIPIAPIGPHVIYEQTFFTNRTTPEETERHLLDWDTEVPSEQLKWVKNAIEEVSDDKIEEFLDKIALVESDDGIITGEALYQALSETLGSPQGASELLVKADIDGIKFNDNSANYVSFRDDNIRVDHKWVAGKQRYQIAGRTGAERLGIRGLGDAEAMERSGATREEIWRETGWWRGRDGEWRIEIPDIRMREGWKEKLERGMTPLAQLVDSETVQAYSLGSLYVRLDKSMDGMKAGMFNPATFEIILNGNDKLTEKKVWTTLAHEIQHVIQRMEGFTGGANFEDEIRRRENPDDKVRLHAAIERTEAAAKEVRDAIAEFIQNHAEDWLQRFYEATVDGNGRIKYPAGMPKDDRPRINGRMIRSLADIGKAVKKALSKRNEGELKHLLEDNTFREVANDVGADEIAGILQADDNGEYFYEGVTAEMVARLDAAFREALAGPRQRLVESGDEWSEIGERLWQAHKDGMRAYRENWGEIEARNVERRLKMSAAERAATPPWETEDVPEERQIVRNEPAGVQKKAGTAYPDAGAEIDRIGKPLIAVHGLSTENLLKAIDAGFFVNPSIALVTETAGWDKGGFFERDEDASAFVIFGKPTIDRSTVYEGDAGTPTFGDLAGDDIEALRRDWANASGRDTPSDLERERLRLSAADRQLELARKIRGMPEGKEKRALLKEWQKMFEKNGLLPYSEAKPWRNVPLSEAAAVLVGKGLDAETKAKIKAAGFKKVVEINTSDPRAVRKAELEHAPRFQIGANRRKGYGELLAKKRPDLDAEQVLAELDKYDDPKKEKLALHWVIRGTVQLPEDEYKVDEALSVAAKAKADPFAYASPMELIREHSRFRSANMPIDPDTVPELTDKRDMGHGVTTYLVRDDEAGQKAVREILNTHYGKNFSPWCLLHGDGHGGLSSQAWDYWNKYNSLPKRVAFQNGKIIAFMATARQIRNLPPAVHDRLFRQHRDEYHKWQQENPELAEAWSFSDWAIKNGIAGPEEWWDTDDNSHEGIPVTVPVEGDPLGRVHHAEIRSDGTIEDVRGGWERHTDDIDEEWVGFRYTRTEKTDSGQKATTWYFGAGVGYEETVDVEDTRGHETKELLAQGGLQSDGFFFYNEGNREEIKQGHIGAFKEANLHGRHERGKVTFAEGSLGDVAIQAKLDPASGEWDIRHKGDIGEAEIRAKFDAWRKKFEAMVQRPADSIGPEEQAPEGGGRRLQVQAAAIPEEGISHQDAVAAISTLRGKAYVNRQTGIEARLASKGAGKLISNDAVGKTLRNGFTARQHNALAAKIDILFENAMLAEDRPDKDGDPNIKSIKRFVCPVAIGTVDAAAWITVKESTEHGHRIYSVEGMKIAALSPTVKRVLANRNSADNAATPASQTPGGEDVKGENEDPQRRMALRAGFSLWDDAERMTTGNDRLVGLAATMILAGREKDLAGKLAPVGKELECDITAEEAIARARKLLGGEAARRAKELLDAGKAREAAATLGQAAQVASPADALMAAMTSGAITANKGQRIQQAALVAVLRNEQGLDWEEISEATGVNWIAALHQRLVEEMAKPKADKGKVDLDQELAAVEGGEAAGGDEDADIPLEKLPEDHPRRKAAEAKMAERRAKFRRVVEAAKRERDARREKAEAEAEKRRKKAEEAARKAMDEAAEDKGGADGAEDSAGDAKPIEDRGREDGPSMEEIVAALLEKEDIDFSDPETVAAILRMLVRNGIRDRNGEEDPESDMSAKDERAFWRNPTVVHQYALSMKNFLLSAARKMLERGSWAYNNVTNMSQEMKHWENAATIERTSAVLIGRISAASIRQTAWKFVSDTRRELKKARSKTEYSELDPDFTRKVKGQLDHELRWAYAALGMRSAAKEAALEDLDRQIEARQAAYEGAGADRDAYLGDNQVMRLVRQREIIEEYGGTLDLLPGEAKEKCDKLLAWMKRGMFDFAQRMARKEAETQAMKLVILKAVRRTRADGTDFVDEGEGGRLRELYRHNIATLEQRLRDFFRFATGEDEAKARELTLQVCHRIAEATQRYEVLLQDGFAGLEAAGIQALGSRKAFHAWLAHLEEPIGETAAQALSNTGRRGMTFGQALNLYGYLCQTDTYAENIAIHGRRGQKAFLESRVLSPEDLKMVQALRQIYAERREELAETKERITGVGFGTPSPFYLPVKMQMDARSGLSGFASAYQIVPDVFSERRKNRRDVDETADIMAIFMQRLDASARAIAYGEVGVDMLNLFGSAEVKDAIARFHGKDLCNDFIDQLTDVLAGVPAQMRMQNDSIGKFINPWMRRGTLIALWGNLNSALKQSVSQSAHVLRRRPGDPGVWSDMFRPLANPEAGIAALKELMASDGWRARYGDGGIMDEVKAVVRGSGGGTLLSRIEKWGMKPLQLGDAIGGIPVALGIYMREKEAYLAAHPGCDVREAMRWASVEAMRRNESTQQSSLVENKPKYARRGGSGERMLMMFASAPMLQASWQNLVLRQWMAKANPHGDRTLGQVVAASFKDREARAWMGQFGKCWIVNHLVIPTAMQLVTWVFQSLLGTAPPPEDELKELAVLVLLGQYGRYVWIGSFADFGLRKMLGASQRHIGPSVFSTMEWIYDKGIATIEDILTFDFGEMLEDADSLLKSAVTPYRHARQFYENRIAQ